MGFVSLASVAPWLNNLGTVKPWLLRLEPYQIRQLLFDSTSCHQGTKAVPYRELDSAFGFYRIRFRYQGRPYKRSLKTGDTVEANAVAARVAETIRLLERGRLQMPPDADPELFIISDGKQASKESVNRDQTLNELLTTYQKSLPPGAKAESTMITEQLHITHLLRHFNKTKLAQSITTSDMQRYIGKRLQDPLSRRR